MVDEAVHKDTDDSRLLQLDGRRQFAQVRTVLNEARCHGCHDAGQGILGSMVTVQDVSADWGSMNFQNAITAGLSIAGMAILILCLGLVVRTQVTRPLVAFGQALDSVAGGDLRITFSESASAEIAQMGSALNGQFRTIVQGIHASSGQSASAARQLAASTSEIATTSREVAQSAEVQQTATERLASATTELSASIGEVGRQVHQCEAKAMDTVAATDAGEQAGSATVGAMVLGISTDDVESHEKFRDKLALNFPLLADTGHQVAEKYGAWREKTRFGKTSMGIQRSTFLIDGEGVIRKVWKSVQVDGHDEQVVKAIEELA